MGVGEKIPMQDGEMLLILQRRMEESDLQRELGTFNEIFANQNHMTVEHLAKSSNAYIRMKVLVESGAYNYDGKSYRVLLKEYKVQIAKIESLIYLTQKNSLAVEAHLVEKNKQILEKNQVFLQMFSTEVSHLEAQLENEPPVLEQIEEKPKEVTVEKIPEPERPSLFSNMVKGMKGGLSRGKEKQRIEERMQREEKEKSRTRCVELPYYDKKLAFTEVIPCKDISAYALFKKKNTVYFGLSSEISKNHYNNTNQTLIELTEATPEFIQFMTEDILQGDYELVPFSDTEKESLRMYFNFMSWCFGKQIGINVTVQEYVKFKQYYNCLVKKMFALEKMDTEKYYAALMLADQYHAYMTIYDLEYVEEKDVITTNILSGECENYLENIEAVISNHMVDVEAKEELELLREKISKFCDKQVAKALSKENLDEESMECM